MERKTTTTTGGAKRSNTNKEKNQRRFSDEQIKLLETVFESETRLEPKKKAEVARELGLQPRQVAIWFQNRRARWKSKQLELDLRALRADYDALLSKFESLKQEKHSLTSQLQKLNDALRKSSDIEDHKDGGSSSKTTDCKGDLRGGLEEREIIANFGDHHDDDLVVIDTTTTSHQAADTSLLSLENWYKHDFNLGGVLDQSRAQWLNFWF